MIYGIRLLEALREAPEVETHLIISNGGKVNIALETDWKVRDVEALADVVYSDSDVAATIASGSFRTGGMIVAPCSMKTLGAVVNSYAANLLVRAADVTLKEGRKLVLAPRETPLHAGHLRLMHEAALMGAVVAPPVPGFYAKPASVEDIVNHTVGRLMDLFGLETDLVRRWPGGKEAAKN